MYKLRYPSIDAMWEAELNSKAGFKVNRPIGSKKRWYQLGNQYWSVIIKINRIKQQIIKELWEGTLTLTTKTFLFQINLWHSSRICYPNLN
jgi:hypothetical protein